MPSAEDLFQRAITAHAITRPQFGRLGTGLPQVFARLQVWQNNLMAAMQSGMREWAELVEREMKANARWQDRTTHARQALRAYLSGDDPRRPDFATADAPAISVGGKDLVVIVTGFMHYNQFLELKDSGRFAIMWPTVVENNSSFMKILVAHGRRVT